MAVSFAPLNDGSHKSRLEAQVTGSGKAWIATNGKTIRGTWKKPGFRAKTRFFDRNGNPVTLTRGQTFVQVVPTSTKITVKDGKVPAAATGVVEPGGAYGALAAGDRLDRPTRPQSSGAGRATSAHTARVSRATSAHVRAPSARSRAAATRPAWNASSDHTARIAVASRAGSPGSTRTPAGPRSRAARRSRSR